MQKRCSSCGQIYWSRWRNEPTTLCAECRPGAVLCLHCHAIVDHPADPAQLRLFDMLPPVRRIDNPDLEERYWSLRAKASQATRRKYPYC